MGHGKVCLLGSLFVKKKNGTNKFIHFRFGDYYFIPAMGMIDDPNPFIPAMVPEETIGLFLKLSQAQFIELKANIKNGTIDHRTHWAIKDFTQIHPTLNILYNEIYEVVGPVERTALVEELSMVN